MEKKQVSEKAAHKVQEENTKGRHKTAKKQALEFFTIKMDKSMKDNGKTIEKME